MSILDSIRPEIRGLNHYTAGVMPKPSKSGRQVKLASNENPFGSSPKALEAIKRSLESGLSLYPDSKMCRLREAVYGFWRRRNIGVSHDELLFGDGSGEVLNMVLAAFLDDGDAVVMPENSFILYSLLAIPKGARVVEVPRRELAVDLEAMAEAVVRENPKLVILSNPDNPTSTFLAPAAIEAFLRQVPETTAVLLDEAYIHFAGLENSMIERRIAYPNLIIAYTFAKAYGLAALRVGYAVMRPEINVQIEKTRLPFNLGELQQAGAAAALEDEAFLLMTVKGIAENRKLLAEGLTELGFKVLPEPRANFIFVDLGDKAPEILRKLGDNGVSLRDMGSFGYAGNYARISIGTKEEMNYVLDILRNFMR